MFAIHIQRNSPIHRLGAGLKLGALFFAGAAIFLVSSLLVQALVLAGVALLYPLAHLSLREMLATLRPVWLLVILITAAHLGLSGPLPAALTAMRILSLVLLAGLITLTTPFSAMIETLGRAAGFLRPLGVDPHRVGLAIALVIRFVPVLLNDYREIEAARAARGARASVFRSTGPLLIKTLQMARNLSEAIEARGFEHRR